MNNIWFTADTHYGHRNIIDYCNRPFSTTQEMNEAMITNWNSVVRPNDDIYHLGDFAFGIVENYLNLLNGRIHLIIGSHDKGTWQCRNMFRDYIPLLETNIDNQSIVLCHYAMRSWHKSHYNSWHLYGHHHGRLKPYGKSFDCGVDTNNFFPYSWEQVKQKMATLEDNFNLVKDRHQ